MEADDSEIAGSEAENNNAQEMVLASEFSQEELHKIAMLKTNASTRDPCFKQEEDKADIYMLRRFLRARDMDVDKAGELFCKYLRWRRVFIPKGYISESEIPNDLTQNKLFLQGIDKKGHPIVVTLAARHFHHKQGGLEEFKRFVVYTLEKIIARMPAGQEKFMAIGDLKGWSYSNSDIRGYLAALSIMQDFYPERLGKLFIVHAPKIFMTVWKVIYPFVDNKTKTKIVFLENKSMRSALLQEIEESQLPEIYGGKQPLVPIHQC